MVHISRKLILELVSLAFAGLILVVCLIGWRLMQGPMDADFLKPVIESTFRDRTGLGLDIGHLTLGVSPIAVGVDKVAITQQDGQTLATIDRVDAVLSRRSFFIGQLAPISVDVLRPVMFIEDTAPPAQQPAPEEKPGKSGLPVEKIETILRDLSHPKQASPFASWNHATITDGAINLRHGNDIIPLTQGIAARLERTAVGFKGQLESQAGQAGAIIGAIEVNHGAKGGLTLHTPSMKLSSLAQIPDLAFLAADTIPVELTATATLSDAKIVDGRLDVSVGQGEVDASPTLPTPLKVASGTMQLLYQADPQRIELAKCEIILDGPRIAADGRADIKDGAMTLDINTTVSNMKLDDLGKFWPPGAVNGGRRWVTGNLSKGTIQTATMHLIGKGPVDAPEAIGISSVTGTLAVSGTTVHYFGQLPDVQDTSANIDYDLDQMTIHLTGGHAKDVTITGGTVVIDGFELHDQTIAIDVDMSGPISSALEIIDAKPLVYAHKLALDPATVKGMADTHLHMAFPLVDSVSVDQLGVTTQSMLHDAAIPGIVAHRDINGLNGMLYVGMGGLELSGNGQLVDIPAAFDYKQSFDKDGQSTATFSGTVDDKQRAELGLDFPDRLKGAPGVSGTYASQGTKATVDIAIDLAPAIFAIDEIGYVKPAGQPGNAKLTINMQNGAITTIDPLSIEAPSFKAQGSAAFDPDTHALSSLSLTQLSADETNMNVKVVPLPGGGSKVTVVGSEFDARRFLHKRREKEKPPVAQATETVTPLEIDVDLARVKTSDTSGLGQVKGQLILLGRKWQRADFKANADGVNVFLSYLPDSDAQYPSYTLHAGTENAGAALSGFALTNSVKGGMLAVDGKKVAITADQPDPPLTGTLTLGDFRVSNPPAFARLFNLLSVTGFGAAISSSDIAFSALTGKFEIDNEQLRISEGRLVGSAIGLTIAGTADRDADTLNLYGTVVPAYGANRLLNSIPVLGPLLTGGDGQGVFAATYSITGAYESPEVSVNPLSVFAPGVLRDFLFNPSDPEMEKK